MLKAKLLGATAAAEVLAIEDVFQSWLYTGNGSTQTITNGIDLAGEGGLVWVKSRSGARDHFWVDTNRGVLKVITSNTSGGESSVANSVTAFSGSGFSIGSSIGVNNNTETYASWTFRQAPRFFDVVTYTGTGANRTIAHDLGVVPGSIIVKRTDTTGDWQVYHRSNTAAPETDYLVLNSSAATVDDNTRWNDTLPTSTVFSLGTNATVNASGGTYVAYLFAHDPLGPSEDGSDGLIACGSYTGNGSTDGPAITLGWEPQWVIVKRADSASSWFLMDTMRGLSVGNGVTGNTYYVNPSNSNAEDVFGNGSIDPTPTGFTADGTNTNINASGGTYIYIAIRRGPMREPTVGTEVFAPAAQTGFAFVTSGFPVDFALYRVRANAGPVVAQSRLTGGTQYLYTARTSAEGNVPISNPFDYNNGFRDYFLGGSAAFYELFRRAPGFFDVVAYTGTGANRTISHNLGAVPELMLVKKRSAVDNWIVYAGDATDYLILNSTAATADLDTMWNDTSPTSSVFSLGTNDDVNGNTATFIAYLFASLPGISKVGSYTGNGSSQTINCAFTTGARFVLIKRTDSTGDWYVWDTARGIVSGNDGRISLNAETAEVTSDDTIDPDSTGFIVNQVAATNVNVNAATYIYFAVS
jgi:hypothetical protein